MPVETTVPPPRGTAAPRALGRMARLLGAALDLGPQRRGRHVSLSRGAGLVEVRGLGPTADGAGPDQRVLGEAVQSALRAVQGIRWAQVNAVTGHVLVLFDEGTVGLGDVVEAVAAVEEAHGTGGHGWSRAAPPHPADPAPLSAAAIALAADCTGLAAAVAGRLLGLGPVPAAARVAVGLVEAQPRLRRLVEHAVGPAGADVLVGVGSGIVNGLTEGIGPLLVTAVSQAQLVAEVRSRRAVWRERQDELCGAPGAAPEHPPLKADRPTPFPDGPVERFTDRVASVSLAAAGATLAFTRDPQRAAALLLVGVPPAARLGREAFAATLARRLARDGVVPMDPGAFRRLDRVDAVVVDAVVLDGADDDPLARALRAVAAAGIHPVRVGPGEGAADTALAAVRRLQAQGHGVLAIATGDDDALAAADVAVAVRRPGGGVGWAADLLSGPGPDAAATVLAAVPVARALSRRVVWVAGAGSAAATLLTALSPLPYSDLTMQPVYATGLLTQLDGVLAARRVGRSAHRG